MCQKDRRIVLLLLSLIWLQLCFANLRVQCESSKKTSLFFIITYYVLSENRTLRSLLSSALKLSLMHDALTLFLCRLSCQRRHSCSVSAYFGISIYWSSCLLHIARTSILNLPSLLVRLKNLLGWRTLFQDGSVYLRNDEVLRCCVRLC